jgi:hypothetical protein
LEAMLRFRDDVMLVTVFGDLTIYNHLKHF